MSQLSDNENSKESRKKLSSKEPSLSERLTGTDSDINTYSIAPVPAGMRQPVSERSFHEDNSKALANTEPPSPTVELEYAGFFRRWAAAMVDDFFLYWLVLGFVFFCAQADVLVMHFFPRILGVDFSRQMFDTANIILIIPEVVLSILLCWLYCAGLESSAMEATPGKRLLRMRVLDIDGQRLTFWKSTQKALIPAMLVLVAIVTWGIVFGATSFIKAPFAMLFTCVAVVAGILAVAAFFAACCGNLFFVNKRNQTLHDLLSKRVVVKRAKGAASNSGRTRFGLLPVELKVSGLVFTGFVLLIAELVFGAYCNVESRSPTPGGFVLNTSGHVWKSKNALKAGSIVDLTNCYETALPLFRTPPFALDPSAKVGRVLVCADISPDSILTYNCVVPQALAVSKIISIEPIQESNYSVSRAYAGPDNPSESSAKHVDYQLKALKAKYPDEDWLINILSGEIFRATTSSPDEIEKLRTEAIESNTKKDFKEALISSDKALALLFEKFREYNPTSDLTPESQSGEEADKTEEVPAKETPAKEKGAPPKIRPSMVLAQAIKTSKMLPATFEFASLPVEYRAVLTDLLMQHSIAQRGLNQHAKATVDAANCIKLLKSLNEDFLVNRKNGFLELPDFEKASDSSDAQSHDTNANADVSSDSVGADAGRYLSMLAKADEKRYKSFLQHIENELK
jgi:uncharacterized RDD family membrane protein YckC